MTVLSHLAFAPDAQAWQAALGQRAQGLLRAPTRGPRGAGARSVGRTRLRAGGRLAPPEPRGDPGWRATGAPRRVFLRPGADQSHRSAAHTRARTAAPPSRLRFKVAAPAASGGDAAARRWWWWRWQGGRHGQPAAIRNPFVRSRGGEPDSAAGPRGARGGVFPESQHGAALRPPARGLERQNRKRRPRLIHSLRARGSAGGGVEPRGCGTRTPVDRPPDCGASPLPPPPTRPCAPPRGSIRANKRASAGNPRACAVANSPV